MIINFVMSSYVESIIFKHIIKYFKIYSQFQIIQTLRPIENANVYYYFRPHLEKKLKENSIVTVHHDLNDKDEKLKLETFIARYQEAKLVVCLNSIQQKILNERGIYHTIIIPHGYNHHILKSYKKTINRKVVLGFFSNFYPRLVKGEDYLIRLSQELSPKDFEFILVGNKRKKLASHLKKNGFKCQVYEHIPYFLFNRLYRMIDALLITSKFEGGPASLPESLATATPVITTKVGMASDLLDIKGLLFFSGDIEKDIITLNLLKKNIEKMSNELSLTAKQKLITWEKVVTLYDKEFIKVSIKKEISFMDKIQNLYMQISYKLYTFYLKKRIKVFFLGTIDTLKLIIHSVL